MWLLALVLPLQSTAIGVFAAKGPSHVHRTADAALSLQDVRRWRAAPVAKLPLLFASIGHSHGGGQALRHHHGRDDASVVRVGDAAEQADEAPGASSLSALALIPALAAARVPAFTSSAVANAGWHPQTVVTEPLDRPPRRG